MLSKNYLYYRQSVNLYIVNFVYCNFKVCYNRNMETILEQQRRYHEERERLVDAMVKEMLHKKITVSFT